MINQFPWRTTSKIEAVISEVPEESQAWMDWIEMMQFDLPTLIADGKTDGWNDLEVVDGTTVSYRYWATQEDAQAWANRITSLPFQGIFPTCTVDQITV